MTFPGHEQDSPQMVSEAVSTAGFAQDVVMATSRLIHGRDLTTRDNSALAECRGLLESMLSPELPTEPSGERQLDGSGTVALLRKARSAHPHDADDLVQTVAALDRLLVGNGDDEDVQAMYRLRDIFLAVGKANLAAMTREPDRNTSDIWTGSIANSIS
jgi:hypothetical protein